MIGMAKDGNVQEANAAWYVAVFYAAQDLPKLWLSFRHMGSLLSTLFSVGNGCQVSFVSWHLFCRHKNWTNFSYILQFLIVIHRVLSPKRHIPNAVVVRRMIVHRPPVLRSTSNSVSSCPSPSRLSSSSSGCPSGSASGSFAITFSNCDHSASTELNSLPTCRRVFYQPRISKSRQNGCSQQLHLPEID